MTIYDDKKINAKQIQGVEVDDTDLGDGKVLQYNSTTEKLEYETPASGAGATNLSVGNKTATTLDIESDTGTDATVPEATTSEAGLLSATDKTKLDGVATGATANDTDANLKNRANHTGTQTASTISDFDTEVANNSAVTANTAKNSYPSADATKVGYISVTQAVDLDDIETKVNNLDQAVVLKGS